MHRLREQQMHAKGARRLRVGVTAAALVLLLGGCVGAAPSGDTERALVTGNRGPSIRAGEFRAGAEVARRFARAYARSAYRHALPRLPGESEAVAVVLRSAAERVPPARRGLRPRLVALRIWPIADDALQASAWIADRRNPPFSIGFTTSRRGGRWLVTTVSPPG